MYVNYKELERKVRIFLENGRDLTPYVVVLDLFNVRFFPPLKVSIISLLFCLLLKSM
jgi:hypothetical protein